MAAAMAAEKTGCPESPGFAWMVVECFLFGRGLIILIYCYIYNIYKSIYIYISYMNQNHNEMGILVFHNKNDHNIVLIL